MPPAAPVQAAAPPPPRLRRGFAFRIASMASASFMVVAIAFSALLWWRLGDFVRARTDQEIEQELREQMAIFAVSGADRIVSQARILQQLRDRAPLFIVLREADGRLLAGPSFDLPVSAGWADLTLHPSWSRVAIPFRVLTTLLPEGHLLTIARDISDDQDIVSSLARIVMAGGVVGALLALGAGWFVSRQVSRRLAAVNSAVSTVMGGDLRGRLPLSGSGDEFDRLLSLINAMLGKLETLMAGLRRVSDDIAHDLRSPLSRLRQRTEAALDRPRDPALDALAFEAIARETDTILETFAALLRIGQVEAGARMAAFRRFDLSAVLTELGDTYEPILADIGGHLDTAIAPDLPLFGDRTLVEQCVVNLIENALRHAGPCPHVVLSARTEGGGVAITVRDHGPGIPAGETTRVLERFYRLDRSRSSPGSGLGLSLAAAVMRLHGGLVTLDDAAPGLRATLTFPGGDPRQDRAG